MSVSLTAAQRMRTHKLKFFDREPHGGTWGRESNSHGQFLGPQKMQPPCPRDAIYTRTQPSLNVQSDSILAKLF